MLKNGKTYFKNLAVFTPLNFKTMFGYFLTYCIKALDKVVPSRYTAISLGNKLVLDIQTYNAELKRFASKQILNIKMITDFDKVFVKHFSISTTEDM